MTEENRATPEVVQMHRENSNKIFRLTERTAALEETVSRLQKAQIEHASVTNKIKEDTTSIVEIFQNAQKGAKFIIAALRIAQYVGGLVISLGAIYGVWAAMKAWATATFHH